MNAIGCTSSGKRIDHFFHPDCKRVDLPHQLFERFQPLQFLDDGLDHFTLQIGRKAYLFRAIPDRRTGLVGSLEQEHGVIDDW